MATEASELNGAAPEGEEGSVFLLPVAQEREMLWTGCLQIASILSKKGYHAQVREPHIVYMPEADRPFYAADLIFLNPHQQPQPQPTMVGITMGTIAETLRGAKEIAGARVSAQLVVPRPGGPQMGPLQ